jgi:hypothetical protein
LFYFTDKEQRYIAYCPLLNDGGNEQPCITDLDTQEEVILPTTFGDLTIQYIDMVRESGDGLVRMGAYIYNAKTNPNRYEHDDDYLGYVFVNSKGEIVKYTLDEK